MEREEIQVYRSVDKQCIMECAEFFDFTLFSLKANIMHSKMPVAKQQQAF